MTKASKDWVEDELAGCRLVDKRLDRRLHALLGQMADAMGESIPLACQDWANTKAAYRFFANDRVGEGDILAGHVEATRRRVAAARGTILVLQDTTEFSFEREHPDRIGRTCRVYGGKDRWGRVRMQTACGMLMLSTCASSAGASSGCG